MSSSGWKKTTLGKVVDIVSGGTPSTNVPEYWSDEIRWVTAKDVSESSGYKIYDSERKISKLGLENCPASIIPKESTILIARGATMGKCCMLGEDMAINQTCYALVANKEKIHPYFLFYSIKNLNEYFQKIAHGAIFNTVIGSGLRETEIHLPPLSTQHRIADILSALDEKIELNRQTNATLEAISQAVFKVWFVDFNFPNAIGEMVESEFGMIPQGWRVGTFHDILNIEIGGDWGKDNAFDGGISVVSLRGTDLEQLKSFGFAPNAPIRWVKNDSLVKRMITSKDILISGSGLGPIGRSIYLADSLQDLYDYPITYSNFCKKLRAETPAHAIYAERLLESIYISGEMRQYFTGTSIPNLDVQSLLKHKILIPDVKILEEYYKKIYQEKYDFLFRPENIHLSQIRDMLLPKLISGEVEV